MNNLMTLKRKDIINDILLWMATISSVVFVVSVEWYNSLNMDDIDFAVQLRDMSIWEFIGDKYMNWQGRYWAFFINAIQIRLWEVCGTMMIGSLLIYGFEIFLLAKGLRILYNVSATKSVLYSILLLTIYIVVIPDISSYFWLCTKSYSLFMVCTFYAFVFLYKCKSVKWYDFIIATILFSFIGGGYEIYSPLILVFMGVQLIVYLIKEKSLNLLLKNHSLYVYAFGIATVSFFLMVFAPGNMIRMEAYSFNHGSGLSFYLNAVVDRFIFFAKNVFFNMHYYIVALVLLMSITQKRDDEVPVKNRISTITRTGIILLGLICLSFILNTYAVGNMMIKQAFSYLSLFCLMFIGVVVYNVVPYLHINEKTMSKIISITFLLMIGLNCYSIFYCNKELNLWHDSEIKRLNYVSELQMQGNKETIFLEQVYKPNYRSLPDDIIRKVMPKYSNKRLLFVTDIYENPNAWINQAYKKYNYLDFEVYSDWVY